MTTAQTNPVLSAIETDLSVGANDILVYFAADNEKLDFVENHGKWSTYERAQAMAALDTYASVTNLSFSITDDVDAATFKLTKSASAHGSLGFMNAPDPAYGVAQGIAWFNTHSYWGGARSGMLDPGSYTFTIFLHEFGHGLGLAHPHDTGGGSTIMPQVGSGDGLDQGVYTVMTYNDGWPDAPDGSPDSRAWGWNSGPSPLDIAVLQSKYGANPTTGAGKTDYVLADQNQSGTGYQAIWDVGGVDRIIHNGTQDAIIDLRAATLLEKVGGGGYVSHASGVHGGFTIAHRVVIENGTGGDGADRITGNATANTLRGRDGADLLRGGAGSDSLSGGRGNDTLVGAKGGDWLAGGRGHDTLSGGRGSDTLVGGRGSDILTGGKGADTFVFTPNGGHDTVTDLGGADRLDLTGFDLIDFAAVQAALSSSGDATQLDLAEILIVLVGFSADDLTEDMVII